MEGYKHRIMDGLLAKKLQAKGAVLIEGPKWLAASGNSVKTGFIGLQMMSWDNLEYFCLSVNYTKSGSKEVYNRIAGWLSLRACIPAAIV